MKSITRSGMLSLCLLGLISSSGWMRSAAAHPFFFEPTNLVPARVFLVPQGVNPNSVPPGGMTQSVTPGEALVVQVFIGNTSPSPLIGYQVTMDCQYSNGIQGSISNFAEPLIDTENPAYVFGGITNFTTVDPGDCAAGASPRIVGAAFAAGPVVTTPKYMGEFTVQVSANAIGQFEVLPIDNKGIDPCGGSCGTFLRTGTIANPQPLSFIVDGLTLDAGGASISILSSTPPNGAIDARQPSAITGANPTGITSVVLHFNGPTAGLVAGDFQVSTDPVGETPSITQVNSNGNDATIVFNTFIPPGAWTRITHSVSGTSTRIGYLPADVNGDRTSGPVDILAIIDSLNNVTPRPIYSTDADRSNFANPADILRVIDLLNGADAFIVWNGRTLPQ